MLSIYLEIRDSTEQDDAAHGHGFSVLLILTQHSTVWEFECETDERQTDFVYHVSVLSNQVSCCIEGSENASVEVTKWDTGLCGRQRLSSDASDY